MPRTLKVLLAVAVFAIALGVGWSLASRGKPPRSATPPPEAPLSLPWRHSAVAPAPPPQDDTPTIGLGGHAPAPYRKPSRDADHPAPARQAESAPAEAPQEAAAPGETDDDVPPEHPLFTLLRNGDSQPVPKEVAELAEQVAEGATNKLQKAQAIYDWITANIQYDTDEWMYVVGGGSGYSHAHDPASVLARGSTVCIGYAWLFDAMARSVGVEATYVIGSSRGYRGTPQDDAASGFKHAWNAVLVDDGWALLDATWGARQIGEDETSYLARRGYYFDTPPDQMIFDHLPESGEWQLLDNPVADEKEFRSLPNLKPAFFESGLKIAAPFSDAVEMGADTIQPVVLFSSDGAPLAATITAPGGATRRIPVATNADGFSIIAPETRPQAGSIIRVFAGKPGSSGFECAADFVVKDAD